MAWSTPHTWAVNEVGTATLYNQQIRDNLDAAAGANKAACRVYNSAALSIANNLTTTLTFNSEIFDRQACHSTGANTSRITIPTGWGGLWYFSGHVEFAANATGYRQVLFLGNGVAQTGNLTTMAITTAAITTQLTISTLHTMAASDYMELAVYQNSGGALNVTANPNFSPQFTAIWLSA